MRIEAFLSHLVMSKTQNNKTLNKHLNTLKHIKMKKIKDYLILILLYIGMYFILMIKWVPFYSIPLLFGAIIACLITPVCLYIITGIILLFHGLKTWVDMLDGY